MSGTTETPWEWIAPTTELAQVLTFSEATAFAGRLHPMTHSDFRKCGANYIPPSNVNTTFWEGTMVLDVETTGDGYQIVNSTISEETFGEAVLENCLRDAFRGVKVPVPGTRSGRRFRVNWELLVRFGMPADPTLLPEDSQSLPE